MQVNLHDGNGNQFSHYSDSSVTINTIEYSDNILVSPQNIEPLHLKSITEVNEANCEFLLSYQPDLIIFGTGSKICYPDSKFLLMLQQKQIGFEVMPIPALCRTYNYLIGEGRNVLGLIIFDK
ncbi:MAG TPA: MTH938/NDUFAF3 family protein [Burkholderiales bacterium]|nr:MTH938/NDUFAF3 family protein [Burkholderiales bacterium]